MVEFALHVIVHGVVSLSRGDLPLNEVVSVVHSIVGGEEVVHLRLVDIQLLE